MDSQQRQQLQALIERIGNSRLEELESVFEEYFKPFMLSLSSEEDRVEAFKIFYTWQLEEITMLKDHVMSLPRQNQSPSA